MELIHLDKREFALLYYIYAGRDTIERLEAYFPDWFIRPTLRKLEAMGFVRLSEFEGDPFYSFMETEQGLNYLKSHGQWFDELGN